MLLSEILTPHQVAEFLAVDLATLRNWRNKNYGPPYFTLMESKTKKVCRYRREDLAEWLQTKLVTTVINKDENYNAGFADGIKAGIEKANSQMSLGV